MGFLSVLEILGNSVLPIDLNTQKRIIFKIVRTASTYGYFSANGRKLLV